MTRAVWSLWSKPLLERAAGTNWGTARHHLLSWVLSFETARRHYPRTALVTDDAGAELLVDRLGLPFESVSTRLNRLADRDPRFWCFGKLHAYAAQEEPFVHIDADVYLWRRLPPAVEAAPVLAQNPELFRLGYSDYRPEMIEGAVRAAGGWLPDEFRVPGPLGSELRGACCGIFGGRDTAFVRHYADLACRLIEHPDNAPAWRALGDPGAYTVTVEQFTVEACASYHAGRAGSPFRDVRFAYLFESEAAAYARAGTEGYTHLIGGAKADPAVLDQLDRRVRADYPDWYERCARLAAEGPS